MIAEQTATRHDPAGPGGRDPATGRLLKGCKGGPGWTAHRRQKIIAAIVKAVDTSGYVDLIVSLHQRALAGDNDAAKVLLQYVVGKADRADDGGGRQTFVFNFPDNANATAAQVQAMSNLARAGLAPRVLPDAPIDVKATPKA